MTISSEAREAALKYFKNFSEPVFENSPGMILLGGIIQSAIDSAVNRERGLADRLHEALRKEFIRGFNALRQCDMCRPEWIKLHYPKDSMWEVGDQEKHTKDCLCAPTLRPEEESR